MTTPEVLQHEQVQSLKPLLEAKNLNFEQEVENAVMQANSRQYVSANPDKGEIIQYVVAALFKLIRDEVKPKKKFLKIVVNVLTLGIPLLFKKKEK